MDDSPEQRKVMWAAGCLAGSFLVFFVMAKLGRQYEIVLSCSLMYISLVLFFYRAKQREKAIEEKEEQRKEEALQQQFAERARAGPPRQEITINDLLAMQSRPNIPVDPGIHSTITEQMEQRSIGRPFTGLHSLGPPLQDPSPGEHVYHSRNSINLGPAGTACVHCGGSGREQDLPEQQIKKNRFERIGSLIEEKK